MDVSEERLTDLLILAPRGRVDSSNSKAFEERVLGHLNNGEKCLLVDFSALDYISSAGLRVFLMAAKRIKAAQGTLALCALNDNVREVFEVTGFSAIFQIYPTREETLRSLGR